MTDRRTGLPPLRRPAHDVPARSGNPVRFRDPDSVRTSEALPAPPRRPADLERP
ncbi:hypothetical protein [Actinomadura sp. WMMB 499]|uniref:hypothetical protein n=1 Tax=Actinomadura sp. WMMB 499 TaxID=1219491 RepID=UPI00159E01DB|nr:hypothetical protein [Actinomadura sp. WMMB 499]